MANVNVRKALGRAYKDMAKALQQVKAYSGIDPKHAEEIERDAELIAQQAADMVDEARVVRGGARQRAVLKKVRKALGYTYP